MNSFNAKKPYNDLPLLPPAPEIETKAVLRKCIEARAALAELKTAGQLIPNQSVLINTIPLLEAKDSSEIENIVTTADNLFRFADDSNLSDSATKEALRYRQALFEGYQSLKDKPLSISTATQVCSVIKGKEIQIRKVPGTALANHKTGDVIYTPPVGEDVISHKLSNWEKFLHYEADIDPLIRMAVGHYQFEAIHPYSDGNGRTGRIINLLYLIQENLLNQPILYLSRYILNHRSDYYSLLLNVTQNEEWEAWILYMLEAVLETSRWTSQKISSTNELIEHSVDYVREALPKIYSRELVEVIFFQPYCRINNLVEQKIAKRETASVYLKQLCDIGILNEQKVGRDKIFINSKFLTLLISDDHSFEKYR